MMMIIVLQHWRPGLSSAEVVLHKIRLLNLGMEPFKRFSRLINDLGRYGWRPHSRGLPLKMVRALPRASLGEA